MWNFKADPWLAGVTFVPDGAASADENAWTTCPYGAKASPERGSAFRRIIEFCSDFAGLTTSKVSTYVNKGKRPKGRKENFTDAPLHFSLSLARPLPVFQKSSGALSLRPDRW